MREITVCLDGQALKLYEAVEASTGLPKDHLFELMLTWTAKYLEIKTKGGTVFHRTEGQTFALELPGKLAEPFTFVSRRPATDKPGETNSEVVQTKPQPPPVDPQ